MPTATRQTSLAPSRSQRIDVRATPAVKSLLQRAAQVRNKTVSEFVLDSALAAAADTLADRRLFLLDEDRWRAFNALLDAPPTPRPRLARLLHEPGVLD